LLQLDRWENALLPLNNRGERRARRIHAPAQFFAIPRSQSRKTMSAIETGLQAVRERIATAARAESRSPEEIELVAVTKTFPAQAVAEAVECGQCAFGENYAQEGVAKMQALRELLGARAPVLTWHFIGPIQSNKTRLIAEHYDWVQGVDRLSVAQRLSQQRPPQLPDLQLCIEVNIGGEVSKHGIAPAEVIELARQVCVLPRVRLRGLMTIPEPSSIPGRMREQFRALRECRDSLEQSGVSLDTLSMGMSDDLEAAIAEGATMVRVGRAIFGERTRRG
jgi:pyridoxal phosphate enzyme (YggS family)